MLFQTRVVCTEVALWLKVKNGQQRSGFMSILSTWLWETIPIVLMRMQVVRDGLNSASARITRSIWWDPLSFLATAGKVVRCVDKLAPFFYVHPFQVSVFCRVCPETQMLVFLHFHCNVLWQLECVLITQSCNIIFQIM